MRKIIFCAIIFFFAPIINIFAIQQNIKLIIDGINLENLSSPPVIINDSVVVPVRDVLEKFDAVLDWKQDSKELFITKNDLIILLKVNNKIANVNGEEKTLLVTPTIINEKLMVPIRFIAETFGFDIKWENSSVIISTEKSPIYNIDEGISTNDSISQITSIDIKNDQYIINANSKLDKITKNILDGNRLVIDIYNSELKLEKKEINVQDSFISKIRTAQNQIEPIKITRVVFDMYDDYPFDASISNDGCSIIVSFKNENTPSDLKNISCNNQTIILKKGSYNIDINNITENDNYLGKKYEFKFPNDIEDVFGSGKYIIQNQFFSSIEIKDNTLTINENKILAYEITSDNENIYIKAVSPKEKYKNILVIDAGHGGTDPGTINGSVKEKDLTFSIVQKVMYLFNYNKDIKVYSTRLSDVKIPLEERIGMANEIADMFISVHINSAGTNTSVNGTEVYYYTNKNDSQNKFSSKTLAQTLLKNLVTNLNSANRNIKTESYVVLKKSTIPAALCEIGFITNPTEFKNLCSEDYQMKAAQAIYNSVISLLE